MKFNYGRCGQYTMFVQRTVSRNIYNFCTDQTCKRDNFLANRYCKMLHEEQGDYLLQVLLSHGNTHPDIKHISAEILEMIN